MRVIFNLKLEINYCTHSDIKLTHKKEPDYWQPVLNKTSKWLMARCQLRCAGSCRPPAFLSSCLLVPPALQTRIYTALQQVARQWRDFNLINSRPQGDDRLCTRCLEEYGVHQFANYHLTLIALASGKWDEVNIRYDDQAIANSKKYETRGNSVDRTTLTSRFCVSLFRLAPPPRRLALPPFWPRS